MASPATSRKQRLRKTKAQLIDEIERLEQPTIANKTADGKGTPASVKMSDPYLAGQDASLLARFPSENPNPVLRVLPDGTVLYANDAAIAVKGLFKGRKKATLTHSLTKVLAEVSRTAEVQEAEFESGDRLLAFSIVPVTGETYINIYGRDITERKRAEEELAEKEAQLRVALDNMPGSMSLVDKDWNYVFFNSQYIELHDYPDGLLKIGGSVLDETRFQAERGDYGPGDPEKLMVEARLPFRSSEPKSYERTLPGGRTLNFNVAPTPEGGYVTIATDITERKLAEKELAEKEAQLRVALDNMPGGMRLIDKDRNYVFFNPQYLNLYDFPEGLLKVGESIRVENLYCARRGDMGPGNPEKLVDDWLADSREFMEFRSWERRISDEKILQVKTSPIPGGGVINIAIDITERKRAEDELAAKEAQLRIVLDNMPGGIIFVDRDFNCVFANAQYSKLFDHPDGLIEVGRSLRDEIRYQAERGDFGPGDTDKLTDEVVAIYQSGEAVSLEREIANIGRTVQIYAAPTPEGGYVTVTTDITERKRAEEQIQAANKHLSQFSEAVSDYLDPMLVSKLRYGGDVEPRVHFVTVFFADLVGSTRLSREMDDHSFGTMIQVFVGEMQRVIKAHRGYLEDISGDGIFGYIGNFDSRGSESDAAEAIVMALKMQLRLADLSNEFESRYGLSEPLRMRIGISSGNALVGKTAGVRAIYTANGDIVNLGAKLEQRLRDLTDAGGILISEQTAALVEGHFALDRHIVTIEGQEMGAYMVDPAQSSTAVL